MTHRHRNLFLLLLLLLPLSIPVGLTFGQQPPQAISDFLEDRPDLSVSENRAEIVHKMSRLEEERKDAAVARGLELNLPIRISGPGARVAELMAFENDLPLYAVTYNLEATISTAANTTRTTFGVDGSHFTVGVWDGGAVRPTHEAFGGRVTLMDNSTADAHATHVGGTIGAAGPNTRSHGMSPRVSIDSYNWNSDKSQMTSRGASFPGENGKIYISNHSYGFRTGWSRTGSSNPQWDWIGQGTNQTAAAENFGKYNSYARDVDSLAYNLPYYLTFWAAGNDRHDDPAQGSSVRISGTIYSYDRAVHPPGDGAYKGGYDLIGFESLAKNVMTVGAVNDAVSSGLRDISRASLSNFSSWGPTDDGRIKPDIVANGVSVYSTNSGSDTAYATMSGTSMAAPNAAGSAQLLISYFDKIFPGHVMRAGTLKGLIIHTADDLGSPGPNYQSGWGLMNTTAAAAHIKSHQASPGSHRIVEAEITSNDNFHSYTFTWDGVSPIRATLSWTDPAAGASTIHDDRTPLLVNNLDLLVTGPEGRIHQPYVMPYVGNWSQTMLSAPATTGKNNTDNVEQVFIAAPPSPGIYTATVTFDGKLINNAQVYGLIISGSDDTVAPEPVLTSISPSNASSSSTTLILSGKGFQTGAYVSLAFPGEINRKAFSQEVTPGRIKARINTLEMTAGLWDVVVTNPDGQQAVMPTAFAVSGGLWNEDFAGDVAGWSSQANPGSTRWALNTNLSHSPSRSYHAPGPTTSTIDNLYSPVIDMPVDASDLSFSFWHSYNFSSNDGGVIEFSLNGGPWFDPTSSGSGASFTSGGYNSSLSGGGKPDSRNALGSRNAWTGNKQAFSEVIVNLTASIYAGQKFQARWRLGTNNVTASPGWYIDDVALRGAGTTIYPTPQFTIAPYAGESPVTGTTVDLYVEARNSDGSPGLTYTWTVDDSFELPVHFAENGTGKANATTATFSGPGSYLFEVTVRNSANISATNSFQLDVVQTPMTVRVEPGTTAVPTGGEVIFLAEILDQFALPLKEQLAPAWTVDPAAGKISSMGIFTATEQPGGPYHLTASVGGSLLGRAEVVIRNLLYDDWQEKQFGELRFNLDVSRATADPDADGVPNLLEYALGGNPLVAGRDLLPQTFMENSAEGMQMVMTFSRPVGLSDLIYEVQASANLIEWTPIPPETWEYESDGITETVTAREPFSENGRRFLRLHVKKN